MGIAAGIHHLRLDRVGELHTPYALQRGDALNLVKRHVDECEPIAAAYHMSTCGLQLFCACTVAETYNGHGMVGGDAKLLLHDLKAF